MEVFEKYVVWAVILVYPQLISGKKIFRHIILQYFINKCFFTFLLSSITFVIYYVTIKHLSTGSRISLHVKT